MEKDPQGKQRSVGHFLYNIAAPNHQCTAEQIVSLTVSHHFAILMGERMVLIWITVWQR